MKKTQTPVRSRTRLPNPATLALWPLVRKYGDHLRERQRKPNSIVTVQSNLKRFCAFITTAGHRKLADITPFILEGYQLSLAALTLRSQQQYLVDVRQFFRWLEQSRQLFENPAATLRLPKGPKRLLKIPSEQQIIRLLNAPDVKTVWGLRDRAWLEVAYATGARHIEMTRLTVADVDWQQKQLRLFGKGDKERLVPLGRQAIYWLEKYLQEARPKLLKGKMETALWISTRHGRAWGYSSIQVQLATYARRLGLPKSLLAAHNLRRACATHLLNHGASPLLLKELLGHVRTATLSHYLRLNISDVQNTHRNSLPGR